MTEALDEKESMVKVWRNVLRSWILPAGVFRVVLDLK